MVNNFKRFMFTYSPLVLPYLLVAFLFQGGHFFLGIFLFVIIESFHQILAENAVRKEYARELDWLCRAIIDTEDLQECKLIRELYSICKQLLHDQKIKIGMSRNEIYFLVKAAIEGRGDKIKEFAFSYFGSTITDKKYTIQIFGYGFQFPTPKLIFEFEDNVLAKHHNVQPHVSSFFLE